MNTITSSITNYVEQLHNNTKSNFQSVNLVFKFILDWAKTSYASWQVEFDNYIIMCIKWPHDIELVKAFIYLRGSRNSIVKFTKQIHCNYAIRVQTIL